jgi:hypothetical protein
MSGIYIFFTFVKITHLLIVQICKSKSSGTGRDNSEMCGRIFYAWNWAEHGGVTDTKFLF